MIELIKRKNEIDQAKKTGVISAELAYDNLIHEFRMFDKRRLAKETNANSIKNYYGGVNPND